MWLVTFKVGHSIQPYFYFFWFQAGHVCWDDYDIVSGKPTGAVRVSFGYMSTFEDAKVDVLWQSCFVALIPKIHFFLISNLILFPFMHEYVQLSLTEYANFVFT